MFLSRLSGKQKHLIKLEQESVKSVPQMDLFSISKPEPFEDVQEQHPVITLLHTLSPDDLSPKKALEQLYVLKKTLETTEKQ